MKESVLHHVWQHRLFRQYNLFTVQGEPVEILDAGRKNPDAGPDFFNAKIKIGTTLWAGNVEIHLNSSDWYKHGHHRNSAYNNVILHVVKNADTEIFQNEKFISQLIIPVSEKIESELEHFLDDKSAIVCGDYIRNMENCLLSDWKTALVFDRLKFKIDEVLFQKDVFRDPIEVFYRLIARAFGTHINAGNFLGLSTVLPFHFIRKYRDNPASLLALFLGQAGFFSLNSPVKVYDNIFSNEFLFLMKKHGLNPLNPDQWKFLRTRPENFPDKRIIQMVLFLIFCDRFIQDLIMFPDAKIIEKRMNELNEMCADLYHRIFPDIKMQFWTKRFTDHLIINAVIPFLFYLSDIKGLFKQTEEIPDLYFYFAPEQNQIIRNWQFTGVKFINAFDTQAFIHLSKCYCQERKCLQCRIGHQVMKKIIQ